MSSIGSIGSLGTLSYSLTVNDQTGQGIASAKSNLSSLNVTTGIVSGAIGGLAVMAGGAAMSIAGSFANMYKTMLTDAVDFASQWESTMVGLKTMFGEGVGGGLGKWSQDYALSTLYSAQGIANDIKKARAMGFTNPEEIKSLVTAFGDLTTAMGSGQSGMDNALYAMSQVRTKGYLGGNDVLQLINAGMPVWQVMGDFYKKSGEEVKKMSEAGQISYADTAKAFTDYVSSNFGGMAQKMGGGTFSGQLQQLTEGYQLLMRQYGDQLVKVAMPALQGLNGLLQNTYLPFLEKGTALWGTMVSSIGELGGKLFGAFSFDLGGLFDTWYAAFERTWTIVTNVTKGFLYLASAVLNVLFPSVSSGMGGVWSVVKQAGGFILNGLVTLSQGFLLVAGIVSNSSFSIQEKLMDMGKFALKLFTNMGSSLIGIMGGIANGLIGAGVEAAEGLVNAMGRGVSSGLRSLGGFIDSFLDTISPAIRQKFGLNFSGWGSSWSDMDFSGVTSRLTGGVSSAIANIQAQIAAFQTKYGLNVSMSDLATKYGVDISPLQKLVADLDGTGSITSPLTTPLEKLSNKVDKLGSIVDGKEMSMKLSLNFDVDVENAGSQEEVEKMSRKLQDDVVSALFRKGVIPAA